MDLFFLCDLWVLLCGLCVALFHLCCFCVNLWLTLYLRPLREHVAFGVGRWVGALGGEAVVC